MQFFGPRSFWNGSPFQPRNLGGWVRLGQEGPTGFASYDEWWEALGRDAGIPYNPPIRATGGTVSKVGDGTRLRFDLNEEARDRIEAQTGERPPYFIITQSKFCNPTPGVVPALGDFVDPETGLVCFLDLPEGWSIAWTVSHFPPKFQEPEATPPYWGEWGIHVGNGVIGDCGKVGPFDTIDEAFSAAADAAVAHGATALPADGFAQVKDSQGRPVGPVT